MDNQHRQIKGYIDDVHRLRQAMYRIVAIACDGGTKPVRALGEIEDTARDALETTSAALTLLTALKDAHDYLSCIPESAAGGDDEAVSLCRRIRKVLPPAEGRE